MKRRYTDEEKADWKAKNEEKLKNTLNSIVELFKSPESLPEKIAYAVFQSSNNKPFDKWSLANKLICLSNETFDARTFQQWKDADRNVKKGSKAFYLYKPITKKFTTEEQNEQGQMEKKEGFKLVGFSTFPVFSLESTDGKEIPQERLELPNFSLACVAEKWGIPVMAVPCDLNWYGQYVVTKDYEKEKIYMATPEEKTFFHELAHAAQLRVFGELKRGQNPRQEISAELSALVLCAMVGKTGTSAITNTYEYIKSYCVSQSVEYACLDVIKDVEKIVTLILSESQDEQK